MNDNVVDFNEALKRVDAEQQNQHEQKCPHCELKSEWASTLLIRLQDMSQDDIIDFVGEMFEWAYDEGKRSALKDILGYAGYNIDLIDGVEEED
jgi:hypothetical protein